ncbi:MAG: DegT/DnrJ/EryC1/StrS family aminotransferase [Acidobacteriota bacterium]
MTIPFVDLKAQFRHLEGSIRRRIDTVLEHGQFILGPEVVELEETLRTFAGSRCALGVASGTDALQIPMMAHGVGPGDAVFVPTFTFTATAEVPLLLGASPVFVDVEEDSFNLSIAHLRQCIEETLAEGRLRPRAIVAVDLFGLPADYASLHAIAEEFDLILMADAAQSFGGSLDGRRVGSLAPITTTSFFPAKPLGGYGDGGAVFTDDEELDDVMRSIRMHGKGDDRYDIVRVGVNGRLDTLQAAILLCKLEVFEEELDARDALADRYDAALSDVVRTPARSAGRRSAWAQYTLQVDHRDAVRERLSEKGIPTAVYYPLPMHLQSAYRAHGKGEGSCPVSEALSQRVFSLPMHPYQSDEVTDRVCEEVRSALG